MSTFTRAASDKDTASITINPAHRVSKINDNIYGGFCEHIGRCIYGGIYDPGNKLSDSDGFRKDVLEALRELNVPVVRYPGGNFCASYHWQDGVGPRDQRPGRPELAWHDMESNQFGTDEFMKWCKVLGTEPYLCLNMGTGTLDEALAWVEYCNGTKNTYYANLRRKNGHPEPYNVKYWALGNEVWGPWQVAQLTKEDYAKMAYQWAKALKLLDPNIELILCGETGHTEWDAHVLKGCLPLNVHALLAPVEGKKQEKRAGLISMHSIHIYTTSNDHLQNVTAPLSAERAIQITAGLIDLACIENGVGPDIIKPTISFDEWNVWDAGRAPGETGAEMLYTLSDALAVSVWLNVFVRQSRYVGMANIAQSVNVISPLMTDKDGIIKQTTWWPLLLFSKYMRGWTVAVNTICGEYDGPTEPAWIRGTVDTPWLDVSATVNDEGWVSMCVVNISEDKDFDVDLVGVKSEKVTTYTVTGKNVGVVNDKKGQAVGIKEGSWDGKGKYKFTKHSLTMLRWKP